MSEEDPVGAPSSDESGSGRVVLISWNVASWPTTLKLIKQHYGSLGQYLDRHGVDILCLQEEGTHKQHSGCESDSPQRAVRWSLCLQDEGHASSTAVI